MTMYVNDTAWRGRKCSRVHQKAAYEVAMNHSVTGLRLLETEDGFNLKRAKFHVIIGKSAAVRKVGLRDKSIDRTGSGR